MKSGEEEGMKRGKREEGEMRRDREQLRRWKGGEELLKEAARLQNLALEGSTRLLPLAAERGKLLEWRRQTDAKSWRKRRVKVMRKLQRSWQSLQIHPGSPKMTTMLLGVGEVLVKVGKDLVAARCQRMCCANQVRCSGCCWCAAPQESC